MKFQPLLIPKDQAVSLSHVLRVRRIDVFSDNILPSSPAQPTAKEALHLLYLSNFIRFVIRARDAVRWSESPFAFQCAHLWVWREKKQLIIYNDKQWELDSQDLPIFHKLDRLPDSQHRKTCGIRVAATFDCSLWFGRIPACSEFSRQNSANSKT